MASLKEIKTRLASVKNTLKITSAMKMVASAKLRKAQSAIAGKLPYEQKLHHILAGMLQDDDLQKALHDSLGFGGSSNSPLELQDVPHDALPDRENVRRVAIVAFSSNSSLCGAFNSNVIKKFRQVVENLRALGYADEDIDVYAVGRKMAEAVVKEGLSLRGDYQKMADKPTYDQAVELASELVDSFASDKVGQVILVYTHFDSAASQKPVMENYLPLSLHGRDEGEPVDYILEPDPLTIVKKLLPMVLMMKIYTVLLDANASEHAARTLAMQVASDNAKDLISELTLAYNKGRQSEITAEILDLVGGSIN